MQHNDDTITFLQQKIEQHMRLVRLYRAALTAELSLRGDDALIQQDAAQISASNTANHDASRTPPRAPERASGEQQEAGIPARVQMLDWMRREGRPVRAGELARALGIKRTTISSELVRAEDAGMLRRVARGLYALS